MVLGARKLLEALQRTSSSGDFHHHERYPLADFACFSQRDFAATRWTLVLRSRGGFWSRRVALPRVVAHWNPVFRFLWSEGATRDVARNGAGVFAGILSGRGFDGRPLNAAGFVCFTGSVEAFSRIAVTASGP